MRNRTLQLDTAEQSLIGQREDNQDRVRIAIAGEAALLIAVDGMGGHSEGARAAEATVQAVERAFRAARLPLLDPQGFLHMALCQAHEDVVALGTRLPVDLRPRATCAVVLVQDGGAWSAHIGDSRVYHLRNRQVLARTRDHSHVELLHQGGFITEAQMEHHPMRNFVESCIGGDAALPEMSITSKWPLRGGDVLLACTDGFWSGTSTEALAALTAEPSATFREQLHRLATTAVAACGPHADNSSAVALRWHPG